MSPTSHCMSPYMQSVISGIALQSIEPLGPFLSQRVLEYSLQNLAEQSAPFCRGSSSIRQTCQPRTRSMRSTTRLL
jgi:hypothetical protein